MSRIDLWIGEWFSRESELFFTRNKVRLLFGDDKSVKETTDTASSASFLDLYLEFDDSGQLSTKIYDKRDDFNFKIINFPNMSSNIPASPAYGVYYPYSINIDPPENTEVVGSINIDHPEGTCRSLGWLNKH